MGQHRFDDMTRGIGAGASRRGAVRLLAAGLGAAVGARAAEHGAARKKKKKRPARCNALPAQAACNASAECCPGSTSRVCSQNFCDESNDPVCCGGIGAACEVHCDCCGELICGINGECVY